MGAPEVTAFLTALAVRDQVTASTQNQALSAPARPKAVELPVPAGCGSLRSLRRLNRAFGGHDALTRGSLVRLGLGLEKGEVVGSPRATKSRRELARPMSAVLLLVLLVLPSPVAAISGSDSGTGWVILLVVAPAVCFFVALAPAIHNLMLARERRSPSALWTGWGLCGGGVSFLVGLVLLPAVIVINYSEPSNWIPAVILLLALLTGLCALSFTIAALVRARSRQLER